MRLPMAKRIIGKKPPAGRPVVVQALGALAQALVASRRSFTSENRAGPSGDDLIGAPSEPVRHAIGPSRRGRPRFAPFQEESVWQREEPGVVTSASATPQEDATWRPRSTPPARHSGQRRSGRRARLRLDGRVGARLRARRGGRRRGHGRPGAGLARALDAMNPACSGPRRPTAPSGAGAGRATGSTPSRRARRPSREPLRAGEVALRRRWAPSARSAALRRRGEGEDGGAERPAGPGRRAARGGRGPFAQGSSEQVRACASMRPGELLARDPGPGRPCARSPGGRACSTRRRRAWRPRSTHSRRRSPRSRSSGGPHVAARLLLAAGSASRACARASFSMLCGRARARLERQGRSAPPEPRGRQASQARRSTPWRSPHGPRQADPLLRGAQDVGGQDEEGRHPLPQRYIAREAYRALAHGDMEALGMS